MSEAGEKWAAELGLPHLTFTSRQPSSPTEAATPNKIFGVETLDDLVRAVHKHRETQDRK